MVLFLKKTFLKKVKEDIIFRYFAYFRIQLLQENNFWDAKKVFHGDINFKIIYKSYINKVKIKSKTNSEYYGFIHISEDKIHSHLACLL